MATYYVANAGSNAANGTSTGTPWQTLAYAQLHISAGDTVFLNKGDTFTEGSGATPSWRFPADNITLDAYGTGAAPIIDGGSATRRVVDCDTHTGTLTRNLTIKNGGNSTGGIWVASSGTNTITDCTCDNHTTDAIISVNNTASAIVQRCTISRAFDDGITLHADAIALIEDCTVTQCQQGINNSLQAGTRMTLTVNRCIFTSNVDDVANLDVTTAIFNACKFSASSKLVDSSSATASLTFNYCLFDASGGSSVTPEFNAGSPLALNNCTFYGGAGNGKMGFVGASAVVTAKNCIISNWNIAANLLTGGTWDNDYGVRFSVSSGSTTTNTNALTSDPVFVSPGTNFALQSSSPCKWTGTPIGGLTTDLAGNAVHNPPSRGAYEFGTAAANTINATTLNAATLRVG